MPRTTQLRTYSVREGLLDEWVERWRAEIVPLRLESGFGIGGAWIDRERNQFVWLISYDGPETFAERNVAYWESLARKTMDLILTTTCCTPTTARSRSGTDRAEPADRVGTSISRC